MRPEIHSRWEAGQELACLVWPCRPRLAIASGPLGGGIGVRDWVLNAQVLRGYDRDDPGDHLLELARGLRLRGEGVGLMTAVNVTGVRYSADAGVQAWATVGVESPAWAAAPDQVVWRQAVPGTINIVVDLPVRLSDAALVNAVATVAEAKSQAMADAGLAGTGTPTDASCLLCPPEGEPEPYGGPRSRWGAALARAVHRAVSDGLSGRTTI